VILTVTIVAEQKLGLIMLSETNPTSTKATDRNILVIVAEETPWFPWR